LRKLILALTALLVLASAATASAATLFGGATANSDGSVTLVSNATAPFSGIAYQVPAGTTFSELETLSVDYRGQCGGGSPRFQVGIDSDGDGDRDGNIFVYLGPVPSFTGCSTTAFTSSGNLIGSTETRFDLTQLGGPYSGTYQDALALLGGKTVTGIQLVVDSGWMFSGGQTVVVQNVVVSPQRVGPPTSKEQCKNGGWKNFNNPAFKNQGDCVSYVATGGRNPGNG
jgi:hypothetical protein